MKRPEVATAAAEPAAARLTSRNRIGAYRSHLTRTEKQLSLLARQRTMLDRQAARLQQERERYRRIIAELGG